MHNSKYLFLVFIYISNVFYCFSQKEKNLIISLKEHADEVHSLAFSPDGKRSQVKIAGGQVLVSTFPLQFVSLGTGADDIQTSKDTGYNVEDAILDAGSNIIVRLNQAKYLQNTRPRNN